MSGDLNMLDMFEKRLCLWVYGVDEEDSEYDRFEWVDELLVERIDDVKKME